MPYQCWQWDVWILLVGIKVSCNNKLLLLVTMFSKTEVSKWWNPGYHLATMLIGLCLVLGCWAGPQKFWSSQSSTHFACRSAKRKMGDTTAVWDVNCWSEPLHNVSSVQYPDGADLHSYLFEGQTFIVTYLRRFDPWLQWVYSWWWHCLSDCISYYGCGDFMSWATVKHVSCRRQLMEAVLMARLVHWDHEHLLCSESRPYLTVNHQLTTLVV